VITITEAEPVFGSFVINKGEGFAFEPLQLYRQEGEDYRQVASGINANFEAESLSEGEYVAILIYEEPITVSEAEPLWKRLINTLFLPTVAYAFFPDETEVVAVPFTIEYATPEPTGASSVLFLPGIQASRLYKSSFFGLGEDRIWPPNALFGNEVNDLAMDENGISEEEVYTRDIIDTTTGVGDVYADFERFMSELESDEVIDSWESFAYDWRYSVDDVAQNGTYYKGEDLDEIRSAVTEIQRLAATSYSRKVTIIGHSNGGLLAKAIVQQLEVEGKADLIDKIIFLASPQLGTPKAIGTILHGYDQADVFRGLVISQRDAREVIQNLPGAYGLLPSEKYFDGLNEPLVTFSDDIATEPYREIYGTEVSSYEGIVSFLKGEDSLDRGINNLGSIPIRANSEMLDESLSMHHSLDNWVAPESVEVIEIVGTGLLTMKSIEYRGIIEDNCVSAGQAGVVCTTDIELKPYANLTHYGDGTVVQRSAEGYGGEKEKYFVNLKEFNITTEGQEGKSVFHHNITEAAPVQELLATILVSTTTKENQFISTSYTEFDDEYEVEIIDSPVRLLATDEFGNQTGVVLVDDKQIIKQEIPGSSYFEFGDTKYFIVPKGTDRTTKLYGEDYGGYTLTIAVVGSNDEQIIQSVLKNASATPNLIAEYTNSDGVFSTIVTDVNSDGVIDYETTLDGDVIDNEETISYKSLMTKIDNLELSKKHKRVLTFLIKRASKYSDRAVNRKIYYRLEDKFLNLSSKIIKRYDKKGLISESNVDELLSMIKFLKAKQ